jgi:hypothetical protein
LRLCQRVIVEDVLIRVHSHAPLGEESDRARARRGLCSRLGGSPDPQAPDR